MYHFNFASAYRLKMGTVPQNSGFIQKCHIMAYAWPFLHLTDMSHSRTIVYFIAE